jgi:hypothetical protein
MKRRRFLQALAATPAKGLIAQQPAPLPSQPSPISPAEFPKLDVTVADAAAETILHFFTASQFAALEKLGGILMPASNSGPGAMETRAPEFLDFLLRESVPERQQLYRTGLDGLNAEARRRFTKPFADLDADQAGAIEFPSFRQRTRRRWNGCRRFQV